MQADGASRAALALPLRLSLLYLLLFRITEAGRLGVQEARAAMDRLWDGLPDPVGHRAES